MFKIGDLVVNKPEFDSIYRITSCKNNYIGKVVEICGVDQIKIETVRANERGFLDCYTVFSKYFKTLKDNQETVLKIRVKSGVAK